VTLEELCERRHDPRMGEWIIFRELANGTGSSAGRRIDVAAFNCWASKNFHRVAYEVKRTRGDFLRECADPAKRAWAEEYFHECWFACAQGVCTAEEVPEGWGLLVERGARLVRTKQAPLRAAADLTPWMTAAILRRAHQQLAEQRARVFLHDGGEVTAEALQALVDARVEERIGHALEETRRARQALVGAQDTLSRKAHDLEAPLQALALACGARWAPLTRENVERWVEEVRTDATAGRREQFEAAYAALGGILGKHDRREQA
jgi:hypothetical protein